MIRMISGTSIDQRDIYLVPVQFSDGSRSKKRPILIISNKDINRKYLDVIFCMISTINHDLPHEIDLTNDDMEEGKLKSESFIRTHRISSVEKSLIYKKIGKLNEEKFEKVKEKIMDIMSKNSTLITEQTKLDI